jgi:AcrR family transcriptional regulator
MASRVTTSRQARERELVAATRALFDEHGMQDAPVEKIAQQVGIARGLIYRHFSSKEELYVLTVTDYLDELAGELEGSARPDQDPVLRLEQVTEIYANYCLRFPAFIDCTLALMRRPARELHESVSESVWLRLGQGIARCSNQVAEVLRAGAASGDFTVGDPDYMANVLWTQTLGIMHLARIRVGIRQLAPGVPGLFKVDPDEIARTCVDNAMATVGARPA